MSLVSFLSLNVLTWIWIAVGVIIFPLLLRIKQPYGRHTSDKWGAMMGNKLGWILQETPSMIFLTFFFLMGTGEKSTVVWFFWGLWMFHYFNRSFIFPLRTKTRKKQIPMIIVFSAVFFNFCNGYLNGSFFGNYAGGYTEDYFTSPRFITGLSIFIIGFVINNWSDTMLINLRKPGETDYKVPHGGLFRWVSCPNYLGEIIEWFGYAVMIGSIQAWSFELWTVVNLVPRALDHHKWYMEKFANYPKDRKAVIPFIL